MRPVMTSDILNTRWQRNGVKEWSHCFFRVKESCTKHIYYELLLAKKWATDCNSCLVLRDGSSGRYPRYSSASLSRANSWDCSLLRNAGRVSRMWLVSCYGDTKQTSKPKLHKLQPHSEPSISRLCHWQFKCKESFCNQDCKYRMFQYNK